MPSSCSAPGCKSRGYSDGCTFHRFPNRPEFRQKWTEKIGKYGWEPKITSVLCSNHFREADIDRTSLFCVRLRENAIPFLFPDSPIATKQERKRPKRKNCGFIKQNMKEKSDESVARKRKRRGRPRKTLDTESLEGSYFVTCCALACTNTSESHVLTRLPQELERRQEWISRIDRQDWTPSENSALCQIHFEADKWEEDDKGVRVLKPDVVPTLSLHGEAIKSWVTLDQSGNVKRVLVRNQDGETNDDIMDPSETTVYIKQEALEPDIEMLEGTAAREEPFEAVFFDSNTEKPNDEDIVQTSNIKSEPEAESFVPEIFPVMIKTETMEMSDDSEDTIATEWSCRECGQNFEERWDMEQHLLQTHADSESAKYLKETQKKSAQTVKNDDNLPSTSATILKAALTTTPTVTTCGNSTSTRSKMTIQSPPLMVSTGQPNPTIIAAPITSQAGDNSAKKYLLLIPQAAGNKQPLFLPIGGPSATTAVTLPTPPQTHLPHAPITELYSPSCATDSSETFFISLARFPEAMRVAIKKKMLEVVETVERLKVNPEMIVIAHKAEHL